jgi:hypothetical protein
MAAQATAGGLGAHDVGAKVREVAARHTESAVSEVEYAHVGERRNAGIPVKRFIRLMGETGYVDSLPGH